MRNETTEGLKLGPVALNVARLEPMRSFYEEAIGLEPLRSGPGFELLGAGGDALVELRETPQAPPRPEGTTGLFHLAILEAGRQELAASLRRLLDIGAPLSGASDHLVSEAIYLHDPEGNGIEIYRDRPAEQWSRRGDEIELATLPLDVAALLAEPDPGESAGRAALGHVHLNVSDLAESVSFYRDLLGLEVMNDGYPGAVFVAADGYHHHFGLNVWQGAGAPRPPAGALGISGLTITLAGADEVEAIAARAQAAGLATGREDGALLVTEPVGVALRIEAA